MIAGNWKMNPETVQEAETLAKAVAAAASTSPAQVAIMVPYVYLYAASKIFKGTNVELGAQTVYFEKKGAFTEAVSSCQVKSLGAIHCLTGHSEERTLFKATDDLINKVCVCDVV
jgi:triosephosphate isomerase